jgi:hypothetical protein
MYVHYNPSLLYHYITTRWGAGEWRTSSTGSTGTDSCTGRSSKRPVWRSGWGTERATRYYTIHILYIYYTYSTHTYHIPHTIITVYYTPIHTIHTIHLYTYTHKVLQQEAQKEAALKDTQTRKPNKSRGAAAAPAQVCTPKFSLFILLLCHVPLSSVLCALCSVPCTLYPVPCTLYPVPCTLCPCALRPLNLCTYVPMYLCTYSPMYL